MSDYEEEVEEQTGSLVDQLGSDPKTLARLEIDQVKFTYLVGTDKLPNQFKTYLYFLIREAVVEKGWSFDQSVNYYYPKLLNAIGGRGQEILLKAEGAKQGVSMGSSVAPDKPGLVDRLLGRENVMEYERWKERKELGLE